MTFFPKTDDEFNYFRSQGYTGSINDMVYEAMGDLGYTGSLSDRIHAFLTFKYGSFYEAMRDLRNGTSVFSLISAYGINSLDPALVFDFTEDYFRTAGTDTTFDSAITHAATTNATMVDSDGLLKWRPHNTWLDSDDLSVNTITVDATVSGNTVTATAQAGAQSPYVRRNYSLPNAGLYTFVIDITDFTGKATNALITFASFTANLEVNVDMSDGTVVLDTTSGAATEAITGGYRLSFTVDASAWGDLIGVINFGLSERADGILRITDPTTADTGKFSRIHAYRSDLGGMVNNPDRGDSYVPTTTAARYLPRRGHHVYNGTSWVNEGLLHESAARTNLITYSEDFTNAAWTKDNGSISSPTVSNPSGLTAVDLFTVGASTALSGVGIYYNNTVVSSKTLSFYVKSNGCDYIQLLWSSVLSLEYANFDLTSGSVSAGTYSGATIENVSGGWFRVSITSSLAIANSRVFCLAVPTSTSTRASSFVGDSVSGFYIYGAQLEAASTPSSYIPTAGATATRAAETLTVPAANMPYSVSAGEELLLNPSFETSSDWTLGANHSISGGVLTLTSAGFNSETKQAVVVGGAVYDWEVVVDSVTEGTVSIVIGNSLAENITSAGSYSGRFTAGSSDNDFGVVSKAAATSAVVSSVSLKRVTGSVSIQMDGLMDYIDNGSTAVEFVRWYQDGNNFIRNTIDTQSTRDGHFMAMQEALGISDYVREDYYNPGILVPFNIASRHGSTFINGAADGIAMTAETTPTALPDLSATDFEIAPTYNGTIGKLRVWADDIGDTGIAEASA